jgi:hypothetical protein
MHTKQIAQILGASAEAVRRQYAKNAEQLRGMAAKARGTGRKVNGYSAEELDRRAANAETMSRR